MWKYNVYYDGSWLHEDTEFETENDAIEDAEVYISGKIDCWELDGVEYDRELFYVDVQEVF